MKIALITPEYPGCGASWGIGRSIATLVRGLREAGTDVLVLVVSDGGSWIGDGSVFKNVSSRMPALHRPFRSARWIDKQLNHWQPDCVEFQNWGGLGSWCTWPGPAVVRLSTPVSLIPAVGVLRSCLRPLHRWQERRTVRKAGSIIANSRCMAEAGLAEYGRAADHIIHHAHDAGNVFTESAGSDVLFVGRLEARKGIDTLLTAWQGVISRFPTARLHLVGHSTPGFDPNELLNPHIQYHGPISDTELESLRRRCSIQVIPSRFESFGLVVLEAWASGLVVISSDGGALPEIVGDAGMRFNVGDVSQLTESICSLLGNTDHCRRLARAGHERLRSCFSISLLAQRSLEAYRSVIENSRQRRT